MEFNFQFLQDTVLQIVSHLSIWYFLIGCITGSFFTVFIDFISFCIKERKYENAKEKED